MALTLEFWTNCSGVVPSAKTDALQERDAKVTMDGNWWMVKKDGNWGMVKKKYYDDTLNDDGVSHDKTEMKSFK